MSQLDLDKPPDGHQFSVTLDPAETSGERAVRLFKDVTLFLVTLILLSMIAWLCFSTLTSLTTTPEEKRWAMSILTAAAGGMVGYLMKK